MKKIALAGFAATASLALAACGSSSDASEEAMADTVEVPAEDAMAGTPEPVEDEGAMEDTAAEDEATAEEVEMDAMEAAEAAQSAVDDVESAISDAEATMDAETE